MLLHSSFRLPVTFRLINNNNTHNNKHNKTCSLCLYVPGSGGGCACILNLCTGWRSEVSFTAQWASQPVSMLRGPEQCLAPTGNWAQDRPARSLDTISTELSGTQPIVRTCRKTTSNATAEMWTDWSVDCCSVNCCSVDCCSVDCCSVDCCSANCCSVNCCSVDCCSVDCCSVNCCSVDCCSVDCCSVDSLDGTQVCSLQ